MKIYKRDVLYFISALAFFQPARYAIGDILNNAWIYYKIAISLIYMALSVIIIFRSKKNKWGSGLTVLISSFVFCFIISSLINYKTSDFVVAIIYTVTICGFISFVCTALSNSPESFFRGYLLAGIPMSTIHLYTILRYQNTGGMRTGISSLGRSFSENWFFLSHANASFFIVFPVIVVLLIYAYEYNKKYVKFAYVYLVFTTLCFYIQWSVAGLVGFALFILFLLMDMFKSKKTKKAITKLLNLRMVIIVSVVVEAFLALYAGMSKYTDLLYLLFNKSQSIFARLRIWTRAVDYIEKRPIIGNGWNYEVEAVSRITSSHTHNILLEFLYCGGLIATVLFIVSIFNLQKKLDAYQMRLSVKKGYRILLLSVVPFVAVSTFDFYLYRFHPLIIYLLLLYYALEEKQKSKQYGKDSFV